MALLLPRRWRSLKPLHKLPDRELAPDDAPAARRRRSQVPEDAYAACARFAVEHMGVWDGLGHVWPWRGARSLAATNPPGRWPWACGFWGRPGMALIAAARDEAAADAHMCELRAAVAEAEGKTAAAVAEAVESTCQCAFAAVEEMAAEAECELRAAVAEAVATAEARALAAEAVEKRTEAALARGAAELAEARADAAEARVATDAAEARSTAAQARAAALQAR
ncbi:hypothetical protein T492DRAFT_917075 [Pavlovales sp. CCMP2436]|nr:hypothetical protein T492DRAFT_917075 [Pavlovales sp. CCMP2436]